MTAIDATTSVSEDGRLPSAADMFNGYLGAHVVFALHELGVLSQLAHAPAGLNELTRLGEADRVLLSTLLETATRLGFVERKASGEFALAAEAGDLVQLQGFITWAVGGYGELLRHLAPLARRHSQFGVDVFRDEAQVAIGSGEADAALMAHVFDRVFDEVGARRLADIGCGNGSRLIRLCRRYPDLIGVCVDISDAACRLAGDAVAEAGLEHRISVVCRDALSLTEDRSLAPKLVDVDTVTSFFMLHDLFTRYATPVTALRRLREAFPRAQTFLLADTMRSERGRPIFSLGYELVHAFMGIPLHTKDSYETYFADAGLQVHECVAFGAPSSWLFVLSP